MKIKKTFVTPKFPLGLTLPMVPSDTVLRSVAIIWPFARIAQYDLQSREFLLHAFTCHTVSEECPCCPVHQWFVLLNHGEDFHCVAAP